MATPVMEYVTTPVPTSAVTTMQCNVSTIVRTSLKTKEDNTTVLASISSLRMQPTSVTGGGTAKLPKQKLRTVISSSLLRKKKQEMSLQEKHMMRIIKTMKQKLKRKEKKNKFVRESIKNSTI
ncbi:hypothetical protein EAI_10699 [Harpegnathos saltator]|uniref:Uncharacterized protein n=1 Tax=Harpegnathos saltator TaxID=610380 RepID=E2BW97_HARSA|nr:hypothetical protein EAI_10699 [Harpegnathos saltator]